MQRFSGLYLRFRDKRVYFTKVLTFVKLDTKSKSSKKAPAKKTHTHTHILCFSCAASYRIFVRGVYFNDTLHRLLWITLRKGESISFKKKGNKQGLNSKYTHTHHHPARTKSSYCKLHHIESSQECSLYSIRLWRWRYNRAKRKRQYSNSSRSFSVFASSWTITECLLAR